MLNKFELPSVRSLTKEQERARALPLDGTHLIVGGPGTGKSVVALLRARRLGREGREYRFLVFNHLLHRACGGLFGQGLRSSTWIGWFGGEFRRLTGRQMPLQSADGEGSFRPFDWNAALECVRDLPAAGSPESPLPALVIDEGQDMPPEFYRCLAHLGFEDFFVVADQNQQLTELHSSRAELEVELALDSDQVIELRRNFRNSPAIARLAAMVRPDDPASPALALPSPGKIVGEASVPALVRYSQDQMAEVGRRILALWKREPRCLVGVITPNNRVRERYLDAIQRSAEDLSGQLSAPRIQTFHGSHRPRFEMDGVDIIVINAQACKGLEFDVVVCADIDGHRVVNPEDRDSLRKCFYVMFSRARTKLILLTREGWKSPIDSLLPQDSSLLQRMVLPRSRRLGRAESGR